MRIRITHDLVTHLVLSRSMHVLAVYGFAVVVGVVVVVGAAIAAKSTRRSRNMISRQQIGPCFASSLNLGVCPPGGISLAVLSPLLRELGVLFYVLAALCYCKPLDVEEMPPVERCFWRQIDPETFQEVWDEMQDEWGTPDSGVTEIFPVESVIIQKLLTEKNDDNEDDETHIERVHRMVDYISNRNNIRNMREPIEFQRIGDEEFMWDNMGTDLWMKVEDDEVMDRWAKRKEEKAKAKRNECGEVEKLCEETSKTKCEKKQPRSAPRPGSC
jgi:hypothetical protein